MTKEFEKEFNHEVLEADIHRLAAELERLKESKEHREKTGPELLKETLRSLTPTNEEYVSRNAPSGGGTTDFHNAPPAVRLEIEYLLDLVFHEGLMKANAAAAKASPFVLDMFHDMLAGKLYPELKRRGVLR